jgi:hypothetical protein
MRWMWLAVALVFAPKSAHAFCRSTTNLDFVPTEEEPCDTAGKPLFWASRCVEVRVHRPTSQQVDLATARSIAAKSFAKWANVTCDACGATGKPSLVVTEAGPTDCDFAFLRDKPNTNVIVFRDSEWNHEPGMLALTTVSFRKDSGEIIDADIEINSDIYQTKISTGAIDPDAFDLESIITHEAGHLIGLAHSPIGDATMRPRYDKGDTTLRDLAPDDVCGVCAAAAPAREAACSAYSAASCDPTTDAGTTPGNNATPAESDGGCAMGHGADTSLWLLLALALSRLRSYNGRRSCNRASSCS